MPNPVFSPHRRGLENRRAGAQDEAQNHSCKGFPADQYTAEEQPATQGGGYAAMAAAKKLAVADGGHQQRQVGVEGQHPARGVSFPGASAPEDAAAGPHGLPLPEQRRSGAVANYRRARLGALSTKGGSRAVAASAAQTDLKAEARASQCDGEARASVALQTFWEESTGSQTACQSDVDWPRLPPDALAYPQWAGAEQGQHENWDHQSSVSAAFQTASTTHASIVEAAVSQPEAASNWVGMASVSDGVEEASPRLFEMPDLDWDWSHDADRSAEWRKIDDTWRSVRALPSNADDSAQLPSLDELERRIMSLNQTLDAQGITRS